MTPYYKNTFFRITTKELYEKTIFDYEKLIEELSPYNIFNFFITAYHLKDYIKAEYNLSELTDIRAFSSDMNELLDLAGFIANKGKHFDVNSSRYENMETRFYSGKVDGTMLCDGTWCIGEGEAYKIVDNNGNIHNIKDIAKRLFEEWEKFVSDRGLF